MSSSKTSTPNSQSRRKQPLAGKTHEQTASTSASTAAESEKPHTPSPNDHKSSKDPSLKSAELQPSTKGTGQTSPNLPKRSSPQSENSAFQCSNSASATADEENPNTNDQGHNEKQKIEVKPSKEKPKVDICPICLDDCTEPKQLNKCGHAFCSACIDQYFQTIKPQCPCCFTIYGEIRGNQPENGIMTHHVRKRRLPGFTNNSFGTIEITYYFPDGIQDDRHPNPGKRYHGTTRVAYLPDNTEGRRIFKLLQKAFELRQTFTVGQSRTTGYDNVVTWNDIHHKTNFYGGMENFGYPDDTYFNRVLQELAAKGIQ
ncbi:unnamed protein product [Rotaria sp. Silwood1]|nr:unnamed protein product [Rotaria sp. Silwood1]